MKTLFLIMTAVAGIASVATDPVEACPLQLPTFELSGFPISQHQVAVIGSAHVEESTVKPTLMLAGMPASPHQIAVLTPRAKKLKIAAASADDPSLRTVGLFKPGPQKSAGEVSCTSE